MAEERIGLRIDVKGTEAQQKKLTLLTGQLLRLTKQRQLDAKAAKNAGGVNTQLNNKLARTELQLKNTRKAIARNTREIQEFTGAIRRSGRFTAGITKGMKNAFKGLGQTLLLAFGTTAVLRGISNTVKIFKDFQQEAANLASILGKTRSEITELTEDAKRLGSSTKFTASEVVKLQVEYAKLGFTQKEILSATEATLDLAAATKTDLAEAASVAGSTVRAFNLDASETQRVTDVMAMSFSTSALDMNKFSTAMATVAPVAANVGETIETTTGKLAQLVDRGVDASTAGTGLRNVFLDLNKHGLTYDEAMDKINNSTNKTKTAFELFGKRGATVATILATTQDKADSLSESFLSAGGAAERMAEEQLDTLEGSAIKLSSAWEGFILSIEDGEGAIGGAIRDVLDFARGVLTLLTPTQSLADKYIQQRDAFEKTSEATTELLKKYNTLKTEAVNNKEKQEELKTVIQQLADLMPTAVTAFDEYGNAVDINTGKIASNTKERQKLLRLQNAKAIDEITESMEENTVAINENLETLNRGTEIYKYTSKLGYQYIDEIELSGKQITRLRNEIELWNAEKAEALLKSQELGVELTKEQKIFINTATHIEHFNLKTGELKKTLEDVKDLTEEELEALVKTGDEEMAELAKQQLSIIELERIKNEQLTAEQKKQQEEERKARQEADKKEIDEMIKKNNEINKLQDELSAAKIANIKDDEQRAKDEAKRKLILEKRRIYETYGVTVESKELIKQLEIKHENDIKKIKSDAANDRLKEKGDELKRNEQQQVLIATNNIEDERRRQEVILAIHLEFAKKRLELLKNSGDAQSEEIQAQIKKLEDEINNLQTPQEDEDTDKWFAKALGVTDEEAEKMGGMLMQSAEDLGRMLLESQREKTRRETNERIKNVSQQHDKELKLLQSKLDKGLISEEEFKKAKNKLDSDSAKKEQDIKKEAFEAEKQAKVKAIAIDLAGAIIKAFSMFGPPPSPVGILSAGLAAISAGVQTAAVLSQKFATGGRIPGVFDAKDDIPIRVSRGEAVVTPKQIANLGGSSAFRRAGVPGFATGGVILPETAPVGFTINEAVELIQEGINTIKVEQVESESREVAQRVETIENESDLFNE